MFVSIINFLENNLEKDILSTLSSKKDIADVVLLVQEYVNKLGTDIIQEVLEEVDRGIKDSPYRKEKWQVVNAEPNTLLTSMGNVTYTRTRFRNKADGHTSILTDEQFGIEPHARMTEDVVINIINEATDSSYRKGGLCASVSDRVSKQTVKNIIHNIDFESNREEPPKIKKQVKVLYVNADEDHVAAQFWTHKGDLRTDESGYKNNTIMQKLIYVYEGIEKQGPKSKRNQLRGKHYFGGLYDGSRNEELWLEVAKYIDETYDMDFLEKVYISGDGASWIKQGVNWIPKIRFVLDNYHQQKYIHTSVVHLLDSADDVKDMIQDAISFEDKEALKEVYRKILGVTENQNKYQQVLDAERYLLNHWQGIIIKNDNRDIIGCSAEGHVSHLYSDRMSSRPMGWTKRGVENMAKLRVFKWNQGNVYDLVMYQKYKEQKKQREYLQDEMIREARARIGKKGKSYKSNMPLLERGKNDVYYETIKACRGICG